MGSPMPAPRQPRGGPLCGTRDAPRDARPGTQWRRTATRRSAGFQDSRFPGSHARITRRNRRSAARWRRRNSGDLETWEPGDLPGAPRAPSKRTINGN